jgi:2-dehydro-3-deoxyphosphogluconate aldolase/(4S)-4-hydroxy-2-oxoglutarate aldolase
MTKQELLAKIAEVGLVPVVRAQGPDEAMKVVDAIREGGVPVLEITMTVPGAIGVMEQLSRKFG